MVTNAGSPKNPAVLRGCHPRLSPPARLRSAPLAQGSASRSCPYPRGAAPRRHRAAEIPRSPARPCPRAPSGAPRARGSPGSPRPSQGALSRDHHHFPLLRGRAVTSVPETSHAPQADSQHPAASRTRTPGPGDNEQPQLTSSAGASRARGRFLCPFSFPFSPPRSGIRPPGAEPPLPSPLESLRWTAGRAPSPRKVTLFPAPTWLLPPPPPQQQLSPRRGSPPPPPESGRRPCSGAARPGAGGAESVSRAGPRGCARKGRAEASRARLRVPAAG